MEYPKRLMKAAEMAAYTGLNRKYFSDLVHYPGQNFAHKMSNGRTSPVIIDTEKYEKWRQRQIRMSREEYKGAR